MELVDALELTAVGGIVSRRDLLAAGARPSSIGLAVRDGRLQRVARGIYSTGRQAELLRMGSELGVLSYRSAAQVIGLDLLSAPERVEVSTRHRRRQAPEWARMYRARLDDDVVESDGLRFTSPSRTLADLGRTMPRQEAAVTIDSALRLGVVDAASLATMSGNALGRGAARLRAAVRASDGRSESVLETLLRLLLCDAGLEPELQVTIAGHDGLIGRVDFLFRAERVVVEADGFAFHSSRDSFRSDRRRGNALLEAGYRVLRFSWEDVVGHPDRVLQVVLRTLGQVGL